MILPGNQSKERVSNEEVSNKMAEESNELMPGDNKGDDETEDHSPF